MLVPHCKTSNFLLAKLIQNHYFLKTDKITARQWVSLPPFINACIVKLFISSGLLWAEYYQMCGEITEIYLTTHTGALKWVAFKSP